MKDRLWMLSYLDFSKVSDNAFCCVLLEKLAAYGLDRYTVCWVMVKPKEWWWMGLNPVGGQPQVMFPRALYWGWFYIMPLLMIWTMTCVCCFIFCTSDGVQKLLHIKQTGSWMDPPESASVSLHPSPLFPSMVIWRGIRGNWDRPSPCAFEGDTSF